MKDALSHDLQRDGAFLPQQARTALLGLRSLPHLTLRQYRRNGGSAGLESLFVRDVIAATARLCAVPIEQVRSLLLLLVDRGADRGAIKTQRRNEGELAQVVPDQAKLRQVLDALERQEMVRAVSDAESDETAWQLDHDYLARAVLTEERAAHRQVMRLREGEDAFHRAEGDWRQRWRALLPPHTQLGLLWARLRGRFRYGPQRRYALLSGMRAMPLVALLGAGTWVAVVAQDELSIRAEAGDIEAGLNVDDNLAAGALLRLWAAREPVRRHVELLLLTSGDRLRRAGSRWPSAMVGADIAEAMRVAAALRPLLGTATDAFTRQAVLQAYGAVVGRLDTNGAKEEATALRPLLGTETDAFTRPAVLQAYEAVAGRLDANGAKEEAAALRPLLERETDPFTWQAVLGALVSAGRSGARNSDRVLAARDVLLVLASPLPWSTPSIKLQAQETLRRMAGLAPSTDWTEAVRWAQTELSINPATVRLSRSSLPER
jgi:hypothetical protein